RLAVWMVWIGPTVLGAGVVSGQAYPNKPIRIVTGSSTGAAGLASRFIAQGISGPLGQEWVVDNRRSGQQELVSRALPYGYTLVVSGSSFWLAPLMQSAPYDPV